MSVLFETSLGDIIVDLDTERCPRTSLNFLKLCSTYYYNFCSFHNVIQDFIAQTGDPTETGTGGESILHRLPKSSPSYLPTKYFVPEMTKAIKHTAKGTLSMAVAGEGDQRGCGSQFFFTLKDELDYLDGKHAPFGKVIEGLEVLDKINEAYLDQGGRPLRDIRIRHVVVLDDPFPDPEGLVIPPESPEPTPAQLASLRVGDDEILEESGDAEELDQSRRAREARAQALTLEMVGDLPFADVAPPENVLFVCKLNNVTKSEDLELIFSRFGEILSCEIIKDPKTGDSLQYAFVEFKEREEAERAYLKMDNVLVDDRRIHVDFSQSVSKLHNSWVFNKTGGRPPPNKGGHRGGGGGGGGNAGRGGYSPSSSSYRGEPSSARDYSETPRSSRGGGGGDLLFDMADVHDDRARRRPHYEDRGGRGGGVERRRDGDSGGSSRREEGREYRSIDRRDDRRGDKRDDRRDDRRDYGRDDRRGGGGGGHYGPSGRQRSRSPRR
ncbi:BZ3500_MvSof-1268-A1-R1_Chr5-3g08227 [Microbotryum saponariae]|uniref:Peptidyl-prolyl cis-trans isomerase n=1 Tax=Microbotryum saponariae TaxID=289078 RepID=A0A2X0KZU7_9BASI|nr:BZ3500_MvSof-1268-A1-R1_Chr5-3g08227 [Microbotryum saponariae]SDA07986.1 BZ3501_MvSof-1269-A2-R1_Chr5-1g07371 [Microbotryum saponariae]